MRSIFVVVPVFNERANIERVVADIDQFGGLLDAEASRRLTLFVDDGSGDGTAGYLRALGRSDLVVLAHERNVGPGAAFRTAFEHLFASGLGDDDLVITLEGDATSDPALLRVMLSRVEEGNDLVLASPYLHGGGFSKVSRYRVLISHVANGLVKVFLGLRGIATFSCFYRIYRGRVLNAVRARYGARAFETNGFECAVEVLAKAVRCGARVSEVPFRVDWSRRKGASKMRLLPTTIGYLRLFARVRG